MSIVIKVAASQFRLTESQSHQFEVEVTDDGRMTFLDHDIECDQAAAEFGYPTTEAMNLLEKWDKKPAEILSRHVNLPDDVLISLANDYSYHVAYIASSYRSCLTPVTPDLHNYSHAAGMAEDAEHIALRAMNGKEPPGYALETVASLSAMSAAFYAAPGPYHQDYNEDKLNAAKKAEQDWQRQHFVGVMERVCGEVP